LNKLSGHTSVKARTAAKKLISKITESKIRFIRFMVTIIIQNQVLIYPKGFVLALVTGLYALIFGLAQALVILIAANWQAKLKLVNTQEFLRGNATAKDYIQCWLKFISSGSEVPAVYYGVMRILYFH